MVSLLICEVDHKWIAFTLDTRELLQACSRLFDHYSPACGHPVRVPALAQGGRLALRGAKACSANPPHPDRRINLPTNSVALRPLCFSPPPPPPPPPGSAHYPANESRGLTPRLWLATGSPLHFKLSYRDGTVKLQMSDVEVHVRRLPPDDRHGPATRSALRLHSAPLIGKRQQSRALPGIERDFQVSCAIRPLPLQTGAV